MPRTELSRRAWAQLADLVGRQISLVPRTARKEWPCAATTESRFLATCTGEPIRAGERYIEHLSGDAAFRGASRYHAECALKTFGSEEAS